MTSRTQLQKRTRNAAVPVFLFAAAVGCSTPDNQTDDAADSAHGNPMITIACQPLFKERIRIVENETVQVDCTAFGDEEKVIFTYRRSVSGIDSLLHRVVELVTDGDRPGQPPGADWEGSWIEVDTAGDDGSVVVIDSELEDDADLRGALSDLEQAGQFAVLSMEQWIRRADDLLAQDQPEGAFFALEAALLRSEVPHLVELTKDDTWLKLEAARATLEDGRAAEGVSNLKSLVENRLQALRKTLSE